MPVWIGITTPLVVIVFLLLSVVLLWRKQSDAALKLLWLAVLFPPVCAIALRSPAYDGWRQFYFLYPPMVALASLAAARILQVAGKPIWRGFVVSRLVAGLLMPLQWSMRHFPLSGAYFNEAIGGSGALPAALKPIITEKVYVLHASDCCRSQLSGSHCAIPFLWRRICHRKSGIT